VAPEEVEPLLRDVLEDPSLALLFRPGEGEDLVDGHGRPVSLDPDDGRERTPVQRAGLQLGMVLHAPDPADRPHRLEEVVAAAGLAIEIARLRVEVRRRLEEVKASRARIVSAGNEERRRIERDLHDGAQQRLVSIGLALRHVQHELGPEGVGPRAALDGVVEEIGLAIKELRELAGGLRPAQIDEGLGPALRDLARRAPLPVDVAVTSERLHVDLEAAAYFIACEGLTNAVKHAKATRVTLSAERSNGHLVVAVTDDGVGGATTDEGSGLRGLSDRVGAHNGALRVESAPGSGTRLVAELPCES
jgi:signal transduction histidine kinase